MVAACGASPSPSPSAAIGASPGPGQSTVANPSSPASAPAGDQAFAAVVADAISKNGQPVADAGLDLDRERALANMGIPDALGADTAAIFALIGQTEAAARAQHPIPPGLGRQGETSARLASFGSFPAPYQEFRGFLTGGVQVIGAAGPNTYHEDVGTDRATQTSAG